MLQTYHESPTEELIVVVVGGHREPLTPRAGPLYRLPQIPVTPHLVHRHHGNQHRHQQTRARIHPRS